MQEIANHSCPIEFSLSFDDFFYKLKHPFLEICRSWEAHNPA